MYSRVTCRFNSCYNMPCFLLPRQTTFNNTTRDAETIAYILLQNGEGQILAMLPSDFITKTEGTWQIRPKMFGNCELTNIITTRQYQLTPIVLKYQQEGQIRSIQNFIICKIYGQLEIRRKYLLTNNFRRIQSSYLHNCQKAQ